MADIIPVTRRERILAAMSGNADAMNNLNEPIRRDERLLYEILQSGGGGGGSGGADLEWRVVQTLPSTGQNSVIYLLPNNGSSPNIYDEYVWISGESRFEVIGSTQIDLSGYIQTATNTSVDGGLASFSGTDGHTLKKATTVGTAVKGVYLGADGVPAAMTHSLETDVPSDAFDPATAAKKGLVKIGDNIDVAGDGTISVKNGSKADKGVLKVGENLNVTDGEISVPDATTTTKGVVKIGTNVDVTNDGTISVKDGSAADKGVVKIGDNISVTSGTISVPDATAAKKGVVKIGTNVDVTNAVISVKDASTSQKGVTQLSSSEESESETLAATAKLANSKVKSVTAGKGLTGSTSNHEVTVKANLLNETPLTNASAAATETSGRVYPVALDSAGKLAVNVPWVDTTYDIATENASGLMSAENFRTLKQHGLSIEEIWGILSGIDVPVYASATGNPVIIPDGADGVSLHSVSVDASLAGTTLTLTRYGVERDGNTPIASETVTVGDDGAISSLTLTTLLGENVIYANDGNENVELTIEYQKSMKYAQYEGLLVKAAASANPVTISDGYAAPVRALSVDIPVTQSGSGDPSPDNVRPITGFDSVTITRTDGDGGNEQSVTISMGSAGTVYGGTLDVTTGLLTVTWMHYHLDGSESEWYSAGADPSVKTGTRGWYRNTNIPSYNDYGITTFPTERMGLITSNLFPEGDLYDQPYQGGSTIMLHATQHLIQIYIPSTSNITEVRNYLSSHPLDVIIKYPSPVTYQLTPAEIATIAGTNIIQSGAGEIDVTYRADVTLAYENLETTVTNAILSLGANL